MCGQTCNTLGLEHSKEGRSSGMCLGVLVLKDEQWLKDFMKISPCLVSEIAAKYNTCVVYMIS